MGTEMEMQAGRELDALVAERVFGLVPCQAGSHRSGDAPWSCHARPDSPDQGGETQCYSTDIAAAWEVVEKMKEHPDVKRRTLRMVAWSYSRTYAAFSADPQAEDWVEANGPHATPLAICRAALQALTDPRASSGTEGEG